MKVKRLTLSSLGPTKIIILWHDIIEQFERTYNPLGAISDRYSDPFSLFFILEKVANYLMF